MNSPVLTIVFSVLLGVAGQFVFKYGLNRMGGPVELSPAIVKLFFTPYIASGLLMYALSTCAWLSVLSKVELSLAYPLLSAGYLIVYIVSVLFLGETFTVTKLLGNVLIMGGITLLFLK